MNFDPEMFGAAIGEMLREHAEEAGRRIEALEARLDGMQAKLDKAMTFAGDFQSALDYRPGSLVRRGSELYIATRHVKSGGALSAREGSGWERFISKEEQ